MATICRHLIDFYMEIVDKRADPRVENFPLMSSPWPMLGIILFYNIFVNKLGPQIMKNREPLNLRSLMIIYNIVQICVNSYVLFVCVTVPYIQLRYSLICEEVDYRDEPTPCFIAKNVWMFFMIKLLDLLDTVFMVLRKKQNQVTFLHIYHHSGMATAGWIATKYIAGGHMVLVGTVNSFVHSVMYFYYLLTVLYPEYKKSLWWKKHLTELQMAQFIVLTWHSVIGFINPYCNYPKLVTGLFIPQNVFMFFMFWDFYRKNYLSKKKENDRERLKYQTEANNNVVLDKKSN